MLRAHPSPTLFPYTTLFRSRKRAIHLDQSKWVYAWTIYNQDLSTADWLTPADTNGTLHFPVEIRSRDPSGWLMTIPAPIRDRARSEEHTSELQSRENLVCRL